METVNWFFSPSLLQFIFFAIVACVTAVSYGYGGHKGHGHHSGYHGGYGSHNYGHGGHGHHGYAHGKHGHHGGSHGYYSSPHHDYGHGYEYGGHGYRHWILFYEIRNFWFLTNLDFDNKFLRRENDLIECFGLFCLSMISSHENLSWN